MEALRPAQSAFRSRELLLESVRGVKGGSLVMQTGSSSHSLGSSVLGRSRLSDRTTTDSRCHHGCVAANQDRSEALRKQYVYRQHTHILTHRPKGRLLREETADYNVLPTPGWNSERTQAAHRPQLEQGQVRDVPGRA